MMMMMMMIMYRWLSHIVVMCVTMEVRLWHDVITATVCRTRRLHCPHVTACQPMDSRLWYDSASLAV